VKLELEHPVAGRIPLVASPMRFSATPLEYELAPPVLGQHTDEILREVLKLGAPEIRQIARRWRNLRARRESAAHPLLT